MKGLHGLYHQQNAPLFLGDHFRKVASDISARSLKEMNELDLETPLKYDF